MCKFSLFAPPVTNQQPRAAVGLVQVWEHITGDDDTAAATATLREYVRARQPEMARKFKAWNFAAVTFGGTFAPSRSIDNLQSLSGLFCIDLDHLRDVEATRAALLNYENMRPVLLFVSPSGDGIKAVYRSPVGTTAADFPEVCRRAAFTLSIDLHLTADPSGKDVSRLCFLPHDPAAVLNVEACPVTLYKIPAPLVRPKSAYHIHTPAAIGSAATGADAKFEAARRVCDKAQRAGIDITGTYQEWIICALSLSTFGEAGRGLFHAISGQYPRYDYAETERQYNAALHSRASKSIEPFFELAKYYGLYAKGGAK